MTFHLDPEAFQSEYEDEQRVLRELAEEQHKVEVLGLVLDLAIAKLEVEMRELGQEPIEPEYDEPEDNYSDVEADADTLASAGMGTDEDYGYYGGDEW